MPKSNENEWFWSISGPLGIRFGVDSRVTFWDYFWYPSFPELIQKNEEACQGFNYFWEACVTPNPGSEPDLRGG